jgi:hypothetical protein
LDGGLIDADIGITGILDLTEDIVAREDLWRFVLRNDLISLSIDNQLN